MPVPGVFLAFLAPGGRVFDAVAFAGDGDDLGVVQEAVQDGPGGGHVAQEFAPFLQRSVAGHDGGKVFVTTHDDFQQVFAGVFGQGLEPQVIDQEEIRAQVFAQVFVLLVEGFIFHEVPDQIEDGAVEHFETGFNNLVANGLGQRGFADARRADQQNVLALTDEVAGGQLEDFFFADGGVETPVEVFQRFETVEVGGFGAAAQAAFLAHVQFVLEDQFKELAVGQAIGAGFLQANGQALGQAGQRRALRV